MGGKRPDQHNIAPSEAGATDYKNLPQTGRGDSDDLRDAELDKQQLAESRKDAKGQPFPPDTPAPSRDVARGTEIDPEQETGAQGAADVSTGKENPLA